MRGRRAQLWLLFALVAALFVAGAVWRAYHPGTDTPGEEEQAARRRGYYLCLNRRPMTPAQMYRLVKLKLPRDDVGVAIRGCQEAQKPPGD